MALLLEPPAAPTIEDLLGFAELLCLAGAIDDLSTAELLAQYASGARPPVTDVESALALAESRAARNPNTYPFRRLGDRLVRDPAVDENLYTFLIFCSSLDAPWRINHNPSPGPIFERVVKDAVMTVMGPGSLSVLFGWPPRDGRATTFPEAVHDLAATLQLRVLEPDLPTRPKDHGVDVVVWQPFADDRRAFPITFVSAGVNKDYVSKAREAVPIAMWKEWLAFGKGPTTTFATPALVTDKWDWDQLTSCADVVLHRPRLMDALEGTAGQHVQADWYDDALTFNYEQIELLQARVTLVIPPVAQLKHGRLKI